MPIPLVPALVSFGTVCNVISSSYEIYYISTLHEKLATPYVDNRTHVYNTTKFIDSRVFNKIEHKTLVYLNQHSSCNFSFPSMRGSEDASGSNPVSALAIKYAVGNATTAQMQTLSLQWKTDVGQLSEACKGHHDHSTAHALELRQAVEAATAAQMQTLSLQWKTDVGQLSEACKGHHDHSTAHALELRQAVEAATAEVRQYQVEVKQDWSTLAVDMEQLTDILATGRLAHRSAGEHREHGHNFVPVLRHAVAHDPVGRELEARLQHLEFFELNLCQDRACQRAVVLQRTDCLHRDDRLAVGVDYVCQLVDEHSLELHQRQVLDKGVSDYYYGDGGMRNGRPELQR
jgi:hypothetical protein